MRIVKIARTIRITRKIRRILSHQNNYNYNTVTKYVAYLTVADDRHPQGVTKSFWWGPQRLASRRATDSASGATEKPGDFAVVADCISWCEASSEMGVCCEKTVFLGENSSAVKTWNLGPKDSDLIHTQGWKQKFQSSPAWIWWHALLDVIFKTHTWTVNYQSTR